MVESWSDHFDEMVKELDRIERQTTCDDMHVSTRGDETRVTLVYENERREDE